MTFHSGEDFGLTSQMRRAAISIPSNIAEGHSRGHTRDLIRFLSISRGSVAELETQLLIAEKLNYVQRESVDFLREILDEEGRMLAGL